MINFSHPTHLHSQPAQKPAQAVATASKSDEAEKAQKNATGPSSESNNLPNNPKVSLKTVSELNSEEKQVIRELKLRDREVRAHEQAHAAAAGSLANGSPNYNYQRGPDGKLYAVGGHVSIDTGAVSGDPQATIDKAEQVQRAALAPAQPSQQDRAVAARAARLEAQARVELAMQAQVENTEGSNEVSETTASNGDEQNLGSSNELEGKCAECGGQHSAESHNTTVFLEKSFASELNHADKTHFNIAA